MPQGHLGWGPDSPNSPVSALYTRHPGATFSVTKIPSGELCIPIFKAFLTSSGLSGLEEPNWAATLRVQATHLAWPHL